MRKTRSILFAVAALAALGQLVLSAGLTAQASGGNIVGTVVDAQGAALPGVTVTATNTATGLSRGETTGADGSFRMLTLPAGSYDVVVELSGYGTLTTEAVVVNVASTRDLQITLQQSTVQESITVVDEAPLIANAPAIGTVVSQKEIASLPLNGRQFANLAVLAPGTSLAYNSDPTKPGQLTIAMNGGIGRNVNFLVDGGDNTDDTIGGALQNFNLEAVQEFKIQTAQYKAEYGRSSGGVLSVVTKTGTNQIKGSAYEFARRRSLNGKRESERLARVDKAPYERDQYGATLGGPIVKDRAHFFATYEKLERAGEYVVNTNGIFPDLDNQTIATPFTDELGTAKVTLDISPTQYLQVRYGFQENQDVYGAGSQTVPSALGSQANEFSSILAGHTWQPGADMLNEAVFQYTTFEDSITAHSSAPTLVFPSGVVSGQNQNTPQTTEQIKYQYKDDLSWSTTLAGRRHDFKMGAAYIHEPTLGGTFETGTAGVFTMLTNDPNGPVREILVQGGGGFSGFDVPVDQYAVYFQDDWNVNDRLTLNVGVRYDLNSGVGGLELDQRDTALFEFLAAQSTYNEGYLRDFRGHSGKGDRDTDNVAPRLGFSWDVTGQGRKILRGGLGRFYDFPYTNATVLFPALNIQSQGFGAIYSLVDEDGILNPNGSVFHPGQPLPPGGATAPGGGAVANVAAPTQATPYSDQISLGYSWQVNDWLGLTAEAINAEYRDIPFRFRFNSTLDANGNPQAGRRFPFSANARMWSGDGEATYRGLNLGFRVRQTQFELQGFYTLSEAEGNVLAGADEFRLGDGGFQSDYQTDRTINSRDPKCGACFGPLYTDARHRLTFGGTYRAPWSINASAFFRYRSALPYNELHPTLADTNGDGFAGDLAPGVDHVNSGRGASNSQFDVRFARDFVFMRDLGVELIFEIFNIFDSTNPATFDRFGDPHAYAGDPGQGEQRLAQIGVRLHF